MKRKLIKFIKKNFFQLISISFSSWLVFSFFPVTEVKGPTPNSSVVKHSVQRKEKNEKNNDSLNNDSLMTKKIFREMMRKHFPDPPGRIDFENQQLKLYKSGLYRLSEAKRVRMEQSKFMKLTIEEQGAFDYFNGTGIYKHYQDVKTRPNIYDTRESFLLKMEDEKIRDNFLKFYNK